MAERDADPEAGLIASLRRLAATGVAIVHTRLALLSSELDEERLRVTHMFVLGAVALFCGFIGVLLATLTVVVAFWDSHRLLALGVLSGIYLAGGVAALVALKSRAAQRPKLFSGSLAELARDRDLLES
jgi:uncharacterized membrane protein YqjE